MTDDRKPVAIDITDPLVASNEGAALASDVLRSISRAMLCIPIESRVAFFNGHLAVMIGGMTAVVGQPLAEQSLALVMDALFAARGESKARLH